MDRVKAVSLNKRSTKQQIEHELGSFEETVHDIIKDEEKILEEQRKETRQIGELKRMVENLSKKLIDIGREYARELESKDDKIMELREALAAANIKISESGEERQKKIADIERKLKQKQSAPKSRHDHITEMEMHLASLEKKHSALKEKGKHKKSDLDRVQRIIDKHKASIAKAKGIPPEQPKRLPVKPKPKPEAKPKKKKVVKKAKKK